MIKIKHIFGDWEEATKEQAKEFVLSLFKHGITCYGCDIKNTNQENQRILNEYINTNKLRGITVEELLKEENNEKIIMSSRSA